MSDTRLPEHARGATAALWLRLALMLATTLNSVASAQSAAPVEREDWRAASPSALARAHAADTVRWREWGEAAFAEARTRDVPLLIFVGFIEDRACARMRREIFSDPEVGALLESLVVPVLVDRHQRPEIDEFCMMALEILRTRLGLGWPITLWMTPDREPFMGGTSYSRKTPDRPIGFLEVVTEVDQVWRTRRAQVTKLATATMSAITSQVEWKSGRPDLTKDEPLRGLLQMAWQTLDAEKSGWGAAPRFPQAQILRAVLASGVRLNDERGIAIAASVLDAMRRGAIRDPIGGGWHRHTLEQGWSSPVFEKMLLDQALIARACLELHLLTDDVAMAELAHETLDFALRELLREDGAFMTGIASEVDGEFGREIFITPAELKTAIGDDDESVLAQAFGGFATRARAAPASGDMIVLRGARDRREIERDHGSAAALAIDRFKQRLLAARAERPRAVRNDLATLAGDGAMITALAQAGAALDEQRYLDAAERAARGALARLEHGWQSPDHVDRLGELAALAEATLALHEAAAGDEWLDWSKRIATRAVDRLGIVAEAGGGFYTANARDLPARVRAKSDQGSPAPAAVLALVMLEVAALAGDPVEREHWNRAAHNALDGFGLEFSRAPLAYPSVVLALDAILHGVTVVRIEGGAASERLALTRAAAQIYAPAVAVRVVATDTGDDPEDSVSPPVAPRVTVTDGEGHEHVVADATALANLLRSLRVRASPGNR